jgi:hypothetical protein
MSSSKRRRVKRGPPPKKPIKRHKYASCLPELMRDFGGRCAYSMQHHSRSGKLEVDHFDPRRKKDLIQDYRNLFPASRHCNGKKSNTWPSRAEEAAGCRFLNPCEEVDYGEQVFEDPVTHRLVGTTPAAVWHIRVCGLNADHLVYERKRRAGHWKTINRKAVRRIKGNHHDVAELITKFREEVELMIPEIPAAAGRVPSRDR